MRSSTYYGATYYGSAYYGATYYGCSTVDRDAELGVLGLGAGFVEELACEPGEVAALTLSYSPKPKLQP
eukprot:scaffold25783_cov52-Phaeocystis_antarctica.AAC.2